MNTLHRFDPQLLPFADPAFGIKIAPDRLDEARATIVEMYRSAALPEAQPTRIVTVPRPDECGQLNLRVFVPSEEARSRPAILEIHGGGFIIGDACISDTQNYLMAKEHDAVVVSVDYRLAPECPYPGPLEDCYTGLAWLFDNANSLGVDVDRVVLHGNSAGGGLAAALTHLVRDRKEFSVAAQFLIYPMLDCRTGADDDPYQNPFTGEFGWTRESNQYGWASMHGSGVIEDSQIGYFSPSLSKDLADLPPAFISVGALDLFLDENVDYATRLIHAGVPTELHVYPGAPHGFDLLASAHVTQRHKGALSTALNRFLSASKANNFAPA